jgi:hypothetical protein
MRFNLGIDSLVGAHNQRISFLNVSVDAPIAPSPIRVFPQNAYSAWYKYLQCHPLSVHISMIAMGLYLKTPDTSFTELPRTIWAGILFRRKEANASASGDLMLEPRGLPPAKNLQSVQTVVLMFGRYVGGQ